MKRFDQNFADTVLKRLQGLDPATPPRWGTMSAPQMIGHLVIVHRYTMGDGPDMPFKGNWKSTRIFKPLIVHGFVAIPKGIRMPRPKGAAVVPVLESTVNDLKPVYDRYLERLHRGELAARMHPFFGELCPKTWSKFHIAHTRHHLKQFGIGDAL